MNILVLSDIETAGEWIATQNMLAEVKKRKKLKIYLLAYGKNTMHLNKNLFEKILLINSSPLLPPFRYYRQMCLEFIYGLRIMNKFKKNKIKTDLIIATEYKLFLPSLIAFLNVRKLFWFHGFRHNYQILLKNFNLYQLILKVLERLSWVVSGTLIVPSEHTKSILTKEMGPVTMFKKFKIISNIVSDDFLGARSENELLTFKKLNGFSNSRTVILYVGRIEEKKGLVELFKSFSNLRKKFRNISLIIAYTSLKMNVNLFKYLKEFSYSNKLVNSIIFLKDQSTIELAKLYRIARVAVLASSLEMDSMFFLESVYSGTPIFTTPIGRIHSLLKEINSQFILKDSSEKSLYHSLNNFLESPPPRNTSLRLTLLRQREKSVNDFLTFLQ